MLGLIGHIRPILFSSISNLSPIVTFLMQSCGMFVMCLPMLTPAHTHNIIGIIIQFIEINMMPNTSHILLIFLMRKVIIICQMMSRDPIVSLGLIDKIIAFSVETICFLRQFLVERHEGCS